jgi:hypothetical protein
MHSYPIGVTALQDHDLARRHCVRQQLLLRQSQKTRFSLFFSWQTCSSNFELFGQLVGVGRAPESEVLGGRVRSVLAARHAPEF